MARRTVVDLDALEHRLRELVTNGDLRSLMGQNGRRTIESKFSWDTVGRQYQALFTRRPSSGVDGRETADLPLSWNRLFRKYATGDIEELLACERWQGSDERASRIRSLKLG